jgi:steroid delta-isomerase-like uncharacterized protein
MADRRGFLALIGAGSALGVSRVSAAPVQSTDEIARQYTLSLNARDMDGFAALFADDYINHQISAAAPPPATGMTPKQATIAFFAARLKAIPDLKVRVEVLVTTEDHFAASFSYSGTQQGVLYGASPTGKSLRFTSCDIFRVAFGKIAEHWGMGDIAGVLAQIKS